MDRQTLTEMLQQYPIKTPPFFLTGELAPIDVPEFFRRWAEVYPGVKQIAQYVTETIANLT